MSPPLLCATYLKLVFNECLIFYCITIEVNLFALAIIRGLLYKNIIFHWRRDLKSNPICVLFFCFLFFDILQCKEMGLKNYAVFGGGGGGGGDDSVK